MRKKYLYFFVLIILLILNFSEIGVQNVQRKTILDFKDELKLTKEQEEKIRGIINGFEKKIKEINEKMVKVDGEIKMMLEENKPMRNVEKKIRELFQLRAETVIEEIKAGREIDEVLNEAQRERWKEIRRGKK